jgi:GNAT superfamily N-acetyltransferase
MEEFDYTVLPLDPMRIVQSEVDQLNALAKTLSPQFDRPITAEHVRKIVGTGVTTIFVARHNVNGAIIGMATLIVSPQLLSGKGWVEDVAVQSDHQGHGIGRVLTVAAITLANRLGISKLDVTSHVDRENAHTLYVRLGWVDRDARLMRLTPANYSASKSDLGRIKLPTHPS